MTLKTTTIAANSGNERAKDAVEAFVYRVAKYIGSYVAAMNGVDAIVFTAGVGENNIEVRQMIGDYLGYLGTGVDKVKNNIRGEEAVISPDGYDNALTNDHLWKFVFRHHVHAKDA